MEIKAVLAFMFLCLSAGAEVEVETEIIKISSDDSREADALKNGTVDDNDWSQIVVERSFSTEKTENESSREAFGVQDESSGKSRIIKRQVIKIPSGVTKVKVIAPQPMPQMRPKRMPPVPRGSLYGSHQRKRPPRRYPHKRPQVELEEEYEEPKHHRTRDSDGIRTKNPGTRSKVVVKEVSPEEFYHGPDDVQQLSATNVDSFPNSVKHTRKGHSRKHQKHVYYGSSDESSDQPHHRPSRRPSSEQDVSYETFGRDSEYSRPIKHHQDPRPSRSYGSPEYEDYAASSIHMKQVPAPNLTGLNLIDPPDMMQEAKLSTFRTGKESESGEHTSRKAPSSREIQSVFPQQYTSHNPHVATNFGLDETKTKTKAYNPPKNEFPDLKPFENFASGLGKFNQHATAASEQQVTTVAVGSNGLQVVQPPQLGTTQSIGPTAPETPRANQRATIRDILRQDCPDHEMLGYCSSPPRYPTIQIANMAVKCPELFDVMNMPVPPEPQDDLTSFSRRSDDDIDIIFDEVNETLPSDTFHAPEKPWSSWSRSGAESATACNSEYTIIEPGYAREVTTGRWFVIVQNSDSSLQKVTTDTCLNPGKPCGGLAGMKCSRNRGFNNGIKSTRCIQRYTHQRLISWDPEAPNKCPRIRVFRFPTACVCHLRLM